VKYHSAAVICLIAASAASAQDAASSSLARAAGVKSNWRGASAPAQLTSLPVTASTPQIHPAVARIVAPGNNSMSFGSGTLIFAGDDYGLVVTNWHVINEATGQISVHFPDGFYSPATIQKVDRDWDLAILAIRRPPNVQPVALANEPPRPGERLTIAGYGSGDYRAASGPCTQYVAPGMDFPFEMVEVAVSARQGDSGGPILNDKGELAGVLFGEGNGRTSGSYCGRVRWFLTSVVPSAGANAAQIAAAPSELAPIAPRPIGSTANVASPSDASEPARLASLESTWESTTAPPQLPSALAASRHVTQTVPATQPPAVLASTRGESPSPHAHVIGWTDIAGESLGEQLKTMMAAVGLLAVILHVLKWMSTEPATSRG
jgi:hypothetical protein